MRSTTFSAFRAAGRCVLQLLSFPFVAAFHEDSFDGSALTSYKLEPAWFVPDTARLTTFARFDEAAKKSDDPLVDCTTTKEEAIRPICLLPASLAPVLMETRMSPTATWPILRAFATKHKIVTQLHQLFTWLSTVGHVVNNDSRIDVFAAADMDPVLHQRRRLVSNSILGAPQTSPTPQSRSRVHGGGI